MPRQCRQMHSEVAIRDRVPATGDAHPRVSGRCAASLCNRKAGRSQSHQAVQTSGFLSVSNVADKLVISSRLAIAMSAVGLQRACDARIPMEGADMEGVASTGVPC
jgi:hypothetical protein